MYHYQIPVIDALVLHWVYIGVKTTNNVKYQPIITY